MNPFSEDDSLGRDSLLQRVLWLLVTVLLVAGAVFWINRTPGQASMMHLELLSEGVSNLAAASAAGCRAAMEGLTSAIQREGSLTARGLERFNHQVSGCIAGKRLESQLGATLQVTPDDPITIPIPAVVSEAFTNAIAGVQHHHLE